MDTYSFRIVLANAEQVATDTTHEKFLTMSDAVFGAGAGADDCSPGTSCGTVFLDFDREADSLSSAIESAISDIQNAGYTVERVEPIDRQIFDGINAELMQQSG